MKHTVKSVIIGRKKKEEVSKSHDGDVNRPCFVSLFDDHRPHREGKIPKEIIDLAAHKIMIRGLDVDYLIEGNDLVIDDLEEIDVRYENDDENEGHVIITGIQEKKTC